MFFDFGGIKMSADIKCFKETGDLLVNMIKGSLEQSHFSGIPIDPKYYDAIESLKKIAYAIQCVGCSNENGEVSISIGK